MPFNNGRSINVLFLFLRYEIWSEIWDSYNSKLVGLVLIIKSCSLVGGGWVGWLLIRLNKAPYQFISRRGLTTLGRVMGVVGWWGGVGLDRKWDIGCLLQYQISLNISPLSHGIYMNITNLGCNNSRLSADWRGCRSWWGRTWTTSWATCGRGRRRGPAPAMGTW